MNEGTPKEEDMYFVPDRFDFVDYLNEFVGPALTLKIGALKFNEICERIKNAPLLTVEQHLEKHKNQANYNQLKNEFEIYPKKMARLNEIVKQINSLKEDEEDTFRKLVDEAHSLLSQYNDPYFI
jgi:hypothetical protein